MSGRKERDDYGQNEAPAFELSSSTHYDETIDIVDADEVRTPTSPNSLNLGDRFNSEIGSVQLHSSESRNRFRDEPAAGTSHSMRGTSRNQSHNLRAVASRTSRHGSMQSNSEDDDDDDDDDDDVLQAAAIEGSYDPTEFDHLSVSGEIKELFQNISRYTPQHVELDYKLRPFVPDFIPAVGDIDAFLKIFRPDGKGEGIGLQVLDEPCASQSEPAVLHLQLRAVAKQSTDKPVVVKKIESAEKSSKLIERWVKDISNLHSTKPPPTVHYTRPMPDIDNLMQEWPHAFEEKLVDIGLPTPDLDCDLAKYVDIVCNLFDIPTYESKIQSLHVLFTLYSAVKNSQYHGNNSIAPVEGDTVS